MSIEIEPLAPRRESRPGTFWLLVTLCVLSALIGRLAYLVRPYDSDGSMFIYMGKLVTEGGRLCHDLVDNKFPTVGLMTSAAWRVFGNYWLAYVLLETSIGLGGSFLLGRAAKRHFGEYAFWPTTLFSLAYLNYTGVVFGGFQLETLQALFAILGAGAALEALNFDDLRDSFVVGLCAGAAAMLKPTGSCVATAFAIAMTLRLYWKPGRLIAHAVAGAVGVAIPACVTLAYLIGTNILADMPALWNQISRYAASSSWESIDWIKPVTIVIIGGFPLFVRGWIFRRPQHRVAISPDRVVVVFVIAWLLLETVGVAAQRRMYAYHFMVMVPPLALLFGVLPRRATVKSLAAALTPMAILSIYHASLTFEAGNSQRMQLSDYVQSHTLPGDYVWKDDVARLLIETDLRPGSRHPMTFLMTNWDTAPLEYGQTILNDFRERKPVYVILPAEFDRWLEYHATNISEFSRFPARAVNYRAAMREINAFVHENYVLESRIDRDAIWRLAPSLPPRSEEQRGVNLKIYR